MSSKIDPKALAQAVGLAEELAEKREVQTWLSDLNARGHDTTTLPALFGIWGEQLLDCYTDLFVDPKVRELLARYLEEVKQRTPAPEPFPPTGLWLGPADEEEDSDEAAQMEPQSDR